MSIVKQAFKQHYDDIEQDYRIFYYSDAHALELKPHEHNYFEMYCLISGKVIYHTCGSQFLLRPNDILFINRHQEHHPVLIDPDVPYDRLLLHVSPQTLRELSTPDADLCECFTNNNFSVCHYPRSVRNNIGALLERLASLQNSDCFGRRALGRACLTELFVEINRCSQNHSVFSFSKETKDMQMVEIIRQYSLDHLSEAISIDDLADYVYMSRFTFMRRFKQCTGTSAYQFIQLIRLQKADGLIRSGMSFTQACQQCGFGDYSAFYRAFLQEYGVSPRIYYRDLPASVTDTE